MAKRLRCYLSLHRWERLKNPAGDGWHRHCRDCGKDSDDDLNAPSVNPGGGVNQGGGGS